MKAIFLIGSFIVSACSAACGAGKSGELSGCWEELPLPPAKGQYVSSMGLEPGGILWITGSNALYYWDGAQFRPPANADLITSGKHWSWLHGGPDRGLYAARAGEKEHQDMLYKLSDGEALYVTDCYREVRHEHPGLYVSKSGQLFNWGSRFLATYAGSEWKRIEALLSLGNTLIFDTEDKVHFYFNENLYSVDREGNFHHREISSPLTSVPGRRRTCGALWGKDRMVILDYSYQGVNAYYLDTGEPADTEAINEYLGDSPVYDIFRAGDGAVWLLVRDQELRSYIFLRISPEGEISPVKETARLGWENTRCWQCPHSVLNASDGSIWLGTPRNMIAKYKDSEMELFGWRQGIGSGGFRWLFEGSKGKIYAAAPRGVYRYRRAAAPARLPSWVERWEEYRLDSAPPVRDSEGNIWMFLEDHPGEMSRWDGYKWSQMEVPFSASAVGRTMSDDRGHVLLEMQAYPDGCYDISSDGFERYDNLNSMLVAAVARGAKRFSTDRLFQGCFVLPGGRIWFGYHGNNRTHFFDGTRWDSFHLRSDIRYLYESSIYGVLLRAQGGKYYAYDRGQLDEVPVSKGSGSRWLWGAKYIQPFEEELLKAHPGEYIPVEKGKDGKFNLLVPGAGDLDDGSSPDNLVLGDDVPPYFETLTSGFSGGHWNDPMSSETVRFFGGRVIRCDYRDTPLLGGGGTVRRVLEDRAHNLWFDVGRYTGARHVFMKRLSGFSLKPKEIPAEVKRSLTVVADASLGKEPQPDARLFWRVGGGSWRGGEPGNSVTIDFPGGGEYEVELVAMGPLGGITPEPLSFAMAVSFPRPDTLLAKKGPYKLEDILWEIPAKAKPSEAADAAHLTYRINDEEWRPAYKGNFVSFGQRKPGEYRVEVAACEEEKYYDSTPLSFDVAYAPDYERIVESRLQTIAEHLPIGRGHFRVLENIMDSRPDSMRWRTSEAVQMGLSELKMAGPGIAPILEKRLNQAQQEAKIILVLQRLLRELKQE